MGWCTDGGSGETWLLAAPIGLPRGLSSAGCSVILVSAQLEAELVELEREERIEMLESVGVEYACAVRAPRRRWGPGALSGGQRIGAPAP